MIKWNRVKLPTEFENEANFFNYDTGYNEIYHRLKILNLDDSNFVSYEMIAKFNKDKTQSTEEIKTEGPLKLIIEKYNINFESYGTI